VVILKDDRTDDRTAQSVIRLIGGCHASLVTAGAVSSSVPWLPVNSSHGHVVTRSTRHRSTRHIRVSSHSQLVT